MLQFREIFKLFLAFLLLHQFLYLLLGLFYLSNCSLESVLELLIIFHSLFYITISFVQSLTYFFHSDCLLLLLVLCIR